jgi:hypothetical protein
LDVRDGEEDRVAMEKDIENLPKKLRDLIRY